MRVLVVSPIYPPEIGGPASYVPALARTLGKNHKVTVITFCRQTPIQSSHNYRLIHIPLTRFGFLRQMNLLAQIIRAAWSADVIYAQGSITVGLASFLSAKLFRKPVVLKFVGDELWENYRYQKTKQASLENFYQRSLSPKFLTWLHRLVLRRANRLVVPSEYLKNFLTDIHKVDVDKITVINNPVRLPKLSQLKRSNNRLVTVGRLVPWKHVREVVKAVARVHSTHKYELEIIGDGPQRVSIKRLITKLKADKYIHLTGRLSKNKTIKRIASSRGLILLSEYEGQSHVLLEAMLTGTPIIASDHPANQELVGDLGVTIPVSVKRLAEALQALPEATSVSPTQKANHGWKAHLEALLTQFEMVRK